MYVAEFDVEPDLHPGARFASLPVTTVMPLDSPRDPAEANLLPFPLVLWQMIGRGTRSHATCKFCDRLPDGKKTEFKIIDFWQNDFNKKADDKPPADMPVLVSLFNTRLKLAEATVEQPQGTVFPQAVSDLRAQISRIPREAFPVKK